MKLRPSAEENGFCIISKSREIHDALDLVNAVVVSMSLSAFWLAMMLGTHFESIDQLAYEREIIIRV